MLLVPGCLSITNMMNNNATYSSYLGGQRQHGIRNLPMVNHRNQPHMYTYISSLSFLIIFSHTISGLNLIVLMKLNRQLPVEASSLIRY